MKHVRYPIAALIGMLYMAPGFAATAAGEEGGEIAAAAEELPAARSDEEIRQSIEKYRERVARLQAEHGAYDPQLSEALLSLGLSLSAVDDHAAAADAFRTALHISRVNHGLHNMEQRPYLELLIQENSILNRQEELYKNYHYLYWLYKRNYGDNDPRLLPVIYRVARWYMDAYRRMSGLGPYRYLADARDLYNRAIEIIEQNYGENDPRLVTPLYELAMDHYYMAVRASREDEIEKDMDMEFRTVTRADYYSRDERESARDRVLDNYYAGRQALDRIIEIHDASPDLTAKSQAFALIYLGDWNMLFDNHLSAIEEYEKAYDLLTKNDDGGHTVEQVFGNPRRLPTVAMTEREPEKEKENASGTGDDSPYAVVAFDVLSNGRARNIRVVETRPEKSSKVVRMVRRMVAGTKFRPRFEDGKPVKTTDVNIKYIIDE